MIVASVSGKKAIKETNNMSASIALTHQGVVMNQPGTKLEDTRPDLQEIINDLLVLKLMAKDGIMTHKSQHDLVKHLNPKELAAVARGVALAEKRAVPCYERTTTPSRSNDGVLRFDAQGKTETNFNR
jgi:hypothetical protein